MNSCFVPVLVLALATLPARAATFATSPTADSLVTAGAPGNNYGGAGAFSLSAPGLPQGEQQSVLQFNLAGALTSFNTTYGMGAWTVQSVTLQLTAASANNAIFNTPAAGAFGISWMQNDLWTEGTGTPAAPGASGITFNNLPTFLSAGDQSLGRFNLTGATSGAFTYSLTLTPGLLNDVLAGDNLSLRLVVADNLASGVFNSRNFGTAASRPVLNIVAVPEPATVTLAALGVVLLGVGCWRRHKQ